MKKGFTTIEIMIVVIWLTFGIGYIMSIVRLCKCDFKAPWKAEIIYSVGLATGFAGVIGYIPIDDTPYNKK